MLTEQEQAITNIVLNNYPIMIQQLFQTIFEDLPDY